VNKIPLFSKNQNAQHESIKIWRTSVANATNIKLVLEIIQNQAKQEQLVVVVSALSKVTDLLQTASESCNMMRLTNFSYRN
jgi:aspartokinase